MSRPSAIIYTIRKWKWRKQRFRTTSITLILNALFSEGNMKSIVYISIESMEAKFTKNVVTCWFMLLLLLVEPCPRKKMLFDACPWDDKVYLQKTSLEPLIKTFFIKKILTRTTICSQLLYWLQPEKHCILSTECEPQNLWTRMGVKQFSFNTSFFIKFISATSFMATFFPWLVMKFVSCIYI